MRNPLALRGSFLNELATPWFKELGDVDRIFEGFFSPVTSSSQRYSNVEETESHYLFNVDMPGVTKEDIKIEVKDGSLMVTGERKYKKANEEESFFYQNSFYLGSRVDTKGIEAKLENGVLNISVPKSEESKPHLIAVK